MVNPIHRAPVVATMRGKSVRGHYYDIEHGLYTRPVRIGARAVGWPEAEVAALQAATIAGKSQNEIRALVRQLEAKRLGVSE